MQAFPVRAAGKKRRKLAGRPLFALGRCCFAEKVLNRHRDSFSGPFPARRLSRSEGCLLLRWDTVIFHNILRRAFFGGGEAGLARGGNDHTRTEGANYSIAAEVEGKEHCDHF